MVRLAQQLLLVVQGQQCRHPGERQQEATPQGLSSAAMHRQGQQGEEEGQGQQEEGVPLQQGLPLLLAQFYQLAAPSSLPLAPAPCPCPSREEVLQPEAAAQQELEQDMCPAAGALRVQEEEEEQEEGMPPCTGLLRQEQVQGQEADRVTAERLLVLLKASC